MTQTAWSFVLPVSGKPLYGVRISIMWLPVRSCSIASWQSWTTWGKTDHSMAQYPKMMGSHFTGLLNRKNDVEWMFVYSHSSHTRKGTSSSQVQSGAKTVHLRGHQLESYHLAGAASTSDMVFKSWGRCCCWTKELNSSMSTKTIKHVCAV